MFDFVSAGFCRGNSVGSEQQRRAAVTCEGCSVKFNVFKRRRQCSICQRFYCSQCLPLGQNGNGNGNGTASVLARFMEKKLKCSKCKVLTARPLSRSQLKQLRVKDLQLYLTSQKVSTRGCVEKDDLVNLLMWHAGGDEQVPVDGNIAGCRVRPSQFTTDDVASASANPCTPSTSQPSTANVVQESTPASEANATFDPGDEVHHRTQASPTASSSSSSSSKEAPEASVSSSSSPSSVPSWVGKNSSINIVEVTDWEESSVDPGPEPVVVVAEEDASPSDNSTLQQSNLSADNECIVAVEVTELMPTVPEEDEEVQEVEEGVEPTEEIDQPSNVQACTGITLSSIGRLEDLEQLTVKQLKELLCLNRVDFRGCCEKAELIERATRLWTADTESRRELESLNMDELCKVCMDAPIECVMLECGHMATCTACGKQLSECPICRQFVVRVVRTFRA